MVDQPAWVNGLIIVGGAMIVAAVVALLIRRRVRAPSGESHNEVAGFIFATVGVLDAVLLAFIVFAMWESYGTAERAVAQESATILALGRYATTIPGPIRDELHDQLRTYAAIVLKNEWTTMTEAAGAAGDQAIDRLWRTYAKLQPPYNYATGETLLSDLSSNRTQRILSSQAVLPPVFWVVLVGASVITVIFCFVLFMENAAVHALMSALLAGIIALSLWLIFELNHPFGGGVQVPKDAMEHALHVLASI